MKRKIGLYEVVFPVCIEDTLGCDKRFCAATSEEEAKRVVFGKANIPLANRCYVTATRIEQVFGCGKQT